MPVENPVDVENPVEQQITNAQLNANIFEKFKSKEMAFFSFPSYLSIEERHEVHQIAEEFGLSWVTSGTRYRKVTVSMNQIEKTAVSTRQKLAKELRSSASHTIPNDNHVDEVVNAPTAASSSKKRHKKSR